MAALVLRALLFVTGPLISWVAWVAVKEFNLSYHNSKTILLTIYPYDGNLNYKFLNSNPVCGSSHKLLPRPGSQA